MVKEEKPIIGKIYFLVIFILFMMVIWDRIDITSIDIALSKRISALEAVVFPEIDITEDPVLGKNDATVTIMIFDDFLDNRSLKFYKESYAPLVVDYIQKGTAKLIFKNYPSKTGASIQMAIIGECMHKQKKFWRFYNLAFNLGEYNPTAIQLELLEKIIDSMNLTDAENIEFTKCVYDQGQGLNMTAKDIMDGSRLGVDGATIFVNQKKINKDITYEELKMIIEEEIKNDVKRK